MVGLGFRSYPSVSVGCKAHMWPLGVLLLGGPVGGVVQGGWANGVGEGEMLCVHLVMDLGEADSVVEADVLQFGQHLFVGNE